jgi:16S rRNA (guanine527-N7)-methyltransferase
MSHPAHDDDLGTALDRHGLVLPADQVARLDRYRERLWDWNQRLNLTRHLDVETFVVRDVLDSLQLAKHLAVGERVLDVGTGGGVPGVVLAIVRPDLHVALCESIGKKAAAVSAIVAELGLPVVVYEGRVQEVVTVQAFDTLVARAVGPLWKILKWLQPHWGRFGRLLLIKGPKWSEERGEARHRGYLGSLELRRLSSYTTPGHYGESVVLAIRRPSFESPRSRSEDEASSPVTPPRPSQ